MIIVSDIDGTLISPGFQEDDGSLMLLEPLKRTSSQLILATSRPLCSIRQSIPRMLDASSAVIASDGAVTYQRLNGNLTICDDALLSKGEAMQIWRKIHADASLSEGCVVTFYGRDKDYTMEIDKHVLPKLADAIQAVSAGRPISENTHAPSACVSIVLLGYKDELLQLLRKWQSAQGSAMSSFTVRFYPETRIGFNEFGELWWLDMSSKNADKSIACANLIENMGKSMQDVIFLCDGENDVNLASISGRVMVPSWAHEDLRALPQSELIQARNVSDYIAQVSTALLGGGA